MSASPSNGAAMMSNPNMRRMQSKDAKLTVTAPGGPAATTTAKEKESGNKTPKSPAQGATAVGGAAGATTNAADLSVNPKNVVRRLNVHFEYNTSDPEYFPRVRALEKTILDEFKGKAKVTSEPAGDTFAIYVNKQLWFSKKQSKNFPDESSLLRSFRHYLDTGDKKDVLAADGAGCVIA